MKKLLTALIAFVMCFSVVTTAFAATPDETSDSDLISDIKQAMLDTYYGDEKPEYLNVEILLDDEERYISVFLTALLLLQTEFTPRQAIT